MTSGDWRDEYRFGGFYVIPPPGVIEPVDDLRRLHHPQSHATCHAHVSLSEPLPRPFTDADRHDLAAALAAVEPITLRYGPVTCFPPYPGVVYAVEPVDRFRALRAAVHSVPLFDGVERRRDHVAPHMTIAEFVSWQRTEELVAELADAAPEGEFLCDRIELAVPNDAFWFERVLTLPLRSPLGAGRKG